ncbi:MFS transporter [Listeria costaricensis]|uniref:MFS transporter n=1 Tax=Listeria costaricensis TaxID=2026604 RepID=UPI000C07DB6F|nr:MFS transporter [Listeria costaricensis]
MENVKDYRASLDEKISVREKFAYGMGDFWTSMVYTIMATYLVIFYTDVAGISAAAVGTIMLIVRLIDAVFDLSVGALVDRTKTRWGKTRPWLLWAGIPFGLVLILLFFSPSASDALKITYAFVTYLLINMIYSAVNIPYGALNALITQDSYQRTLLNIFRMTSAYVGAVILNLFAMPLINSFENESMGWFLTFGLVGVLIPFGYLFTFKFTKERVTPNVVKDGTKISLKRELNALFHNKYWVIMVVMSLCVWINSGITNGLNAYMAKYVLGDSNLVGVIGNVGLIPLIIGVPLMGPVIKRFGKRNTSLIGVFLIIPASLMILIDPTSPAILYTSVALRSIASVPLTASMNPMLTDTIDYGEWKYGIRSEGLVFSASSFGMKVGAGLSSAMVGWILAFAHYDGTLATQSAATLDSIINSYIWIPIVMTVLLVVLLFVYKLDKLQPEIVAELNDVRKIRVD